jgi:hypothetical protein
MTIPGEYSHDTKFQQQGPGGAAFGTTRNDKTWAFRLDLLNRRFEYRGFAPRLSLIYVADQSTIALYRFNRFQAQVGITRQF